MDYFLAIIKKHKFIYIVIIGLTFTILMVNNILEFAERVINNHLLLVISLVIFYFLVLIAIRKETKNK